MITTNQKTNNAPKVRQRKSGKCTHDIPVEFCGFGCQKMPEYQEYLSALKARAEAADEEDGMGFHPGFPPGFDPKRAEQGLAQLDQSGRACRVCGCTEIDCRQCIEKTGEPCYWVKPDLCSACAPADDFTAPRCDECKRTDGAHTQECSKNLDRLTYEDYLGYCKTQYKTNAATYARKMEVARDPGQDEFVREWKRRQSGNSLDHKAEQKKPQRAGPADSDHKRLHNDAIARWRRERPASADMNEPPVDSNGDQPGLQMIPVSQIKPSPTNPRKYFDPDKLQELADSILEHGLLEPIIVRPLRRTTTGALIGGDIGETLKAWPGLAGNLYYELIAGERRWRAAQLAGLTHIEAKVRNYDDRAALEVQLVENLQRADISPIEEADGYMAMLDLKNPDGTSVYTVDSLAAKIGKKGKSKSYVYGRLKLRNLPAPALEAIAKGDLPATIGELIGRLPSPELRQKFWDSNFYDYGKDWFRAPSFRDIKQKIESSYIVELKGAPFDQNDKKLVPAAGNCKNCPKRTGNNRAEYPDGRADLCTDVNCFDLKTRLARERQLKAFAGDGVEVLNTEEAKQWFSWGSLSYGKMKQFVDLADKCEDAPDPADEDADYPTYAELLGDIKPDVVGADDRGQIHRLVKKERAAEILRSKHGIEIEGDDDRSSVPSYSRESEQEREERKSLKKARELAVENIAAKVAEWYDQEFLVRSVHGTFPLANLLRTVAGAMLYYFDSSAGLYDTLKRRNPNAEELQKLDEFEISENEAAAKLVEGLDAADIIGTLAEICVRAELHGWAMGWQNEDRGHPICDFAGFKLEQFEQEALDALKPVEFKAKTKSKPKAVATA